MAAHVKPIPRRRTTLKERLFFPAIFQGMGITIRHFLEGLRGKTVTMQYPEERWEVKDNYRGAPVLVKDDEGRPKCVASGVRDPRSPIGSIEVRSPT